MLAAFGSDYSVPGILKALWAHKPGGDIGQSPFLSHPCGDETHLHLANRKNCIIPFANVLICTTLTEILTTGFIMLSAGPGITVLKTFYVI